MSIEDEARAAYAAYVDSRKRIEAGELPWSSLDRFFTDDVTFIDPAWGRVEGIDEARKFWDESMTGLESWRFPEIWTMVEGNRVVSMWWQVMGASDDGSEIKVPGISVLYYAGDGRFCYEHDVMNMAHVMEAITESGWVPEGDFNLPPESPNRDASLPAGRADITTDAL